MSCKACLFSWLYSYHIICNAIKAGNIMCRHMYSIRQPLSYMYTHPTMMYAYVTDYLCPMPMKGCGKSAGVRSEVSLCVILLPSGRHLLI